MSRYSYFIGLIFHFEFKNETKYTVKLFIFTLFMKTTFSQVRHPSHPGRGHESLTGHMT